LWNGEGNQYETVVTTVSPVSVVEIDPEGDSSDRRRGNNRDPIQRKLLLHRYGVGYDVNTSFLSYELGLLFRPVYEPRHQWGAEFFHSDQREISLIHYSQVLQNKHVLTAGLSHRVPRSREGIPDEAAASTAHFSYSLRYPSIPILPNTIQWLAGEVSHVHMTFGYDQGLSSHANESLQSAQIDIRRSFSFSNYHEIGTRMLTGFSSGGLFKGNRFFLGGESHLRGFNPLRFGGEHINLFSLEYRFPLLYETDINLLGLAVTHTLQVALFSDLGNVADGSSDLFHLSDYKSGVGAGIRWFADSFGIMPIIFRVDVAWPIDSPVEEENEAHYYINAGQPF
jgi:hypothetical protein